MQAGASPLHQRLWVLEKFKGQWRTVFCVFRQANLHLRNNETNRAPAKVYKRKKPKSKRNRCHTAGSSNCSVRSRCPAGHHCMGPPARRRVCAAPAAAAYPGGAGSVARQAVAQPRARLSPPHRSRRAAPPAPAPAVPPGVPLVAHTTSQGPGRRAAQAPLTTPSVVPRARLKMNPMPNVA